MSVTHFRPIGGSPWRAVAVAGLAWLSLSATPAHAALFSDDEARQAVLDLRARVDNLGSQLAAAQRTIIDQSGKLDQLTQQVATLRGQNEDLTNQLSTVQRSQKDYYTDLDGRLKKLEPQQLTVDGVQGLAQPGETESFNAALEQFKNGDYKGATASFNDFVQKYPQSPYQPTAQYWLGNAYYAQRNYARSTEMFQRVVRGFPTHERAPDALLGIATNQIEQGQKAAARQTLKQIITQYSGSAAAQSAQGKLSALR